MPLEGTSQPAAKRIEINTGSMHLTAGEAVLRKEIWVEQYGSSIAVGNASSRVLEYTIFPDADD